MDDIPTPALQSNAVITGIGSYVPEHILSNADLEKLVDTSDEWIVQRTGIRERRIASEQQFASHLCAAAVYNMMERYPVSVHDVDYVIVATSTPDATFPSTAALVSDRLGIASCGAVDIQAACAGFAAALQLANGLLLSGAYRKILVIGAETLSKITDYTDRTTCILFGDGASAFLLEAAAGSRKGDILAAYADTDGALGHHIYRNQLAPFIGEHELNDSGFIVQNGREVYRWALSQVSKGIEVMLARAGLAPGQIDWFIPHSANMRIIEGLSERTGFASEQTLSSIERYGNTSAASIPLALDEAVKAGRIQQGHTLLLYGFGGGLTQAGVLIRWSLQNTR